MVLLNSMRSSHIFAQSGCLPKLLPEAILESISEAATDDAELDVMGSLDGDRLLELFADVSAELPCNIGADVALLSVLVAIEDAPCELLPTQLESITETAQIQNNLLINIDSSKPVFYLTYVTMLTLSVSGS